MDISNLVVARYNDGRVLKGTTRDFSANRTMFHIEVQESGEVIELRCRQLKALFFVRSLEGDSKRQDLRGFVDGPQETSHGRKIATRFRDGEFLCGYTLSWSPDREGFFLFPADSGGNNQRIWVVSAATQEIKAGPAAEALAERMLGEEAKRPNDEAPAAAAPPASAAMPRPAAGGRPTAAYLRPSSAMSRPKPGDRTDAA